jgi:hypothetical protein
MFSCFALPYSFSVVPSASGPVFMFCVPGLIFVGTECVVSCFPILRSRTRFRWYRGRQVPFSCLYLPDSFSLVQRASCPVFMFCACGLIFGGTEGVGSRFQVLRSRTHFRRNRVRRVPVFIFFPPVLVFGGAGLVFLFCAPGFIFDGTEEVESLFHVMRSMTHFRRYRGLQVPFSCFTLSFALSDTFSVLPSTSGPVFVYCAPGLIFGGTVSVGSSFHVLRARTHFRRYRRRRVPISCFALPDSYSAVLRASGPVFIFCAPGLVFGRTEGVGSSFHVLHSRTRIRYYRRRRVRFSCIALPDSFSAAPWASGPVFMFCAPGIVFNGTEGVGFRFNVLRCRTRFRRYRGRRFPFSCFALPDSFSAVPRASCPVFIFCTPGVVFGGTEGVGSRFHVLRARTHFGDSKGVGSRFHVLCSKTRFRRCRVRQVLF